MSLTRSRTSYILKSHWKERPNLHRWRLSYKLVDFEPNNLEKLKIGHLLDAIRAFEIVIYLKMCRKPRANFLSSGTLHFLRAVLIGNEVKTSLKHIV